MVLVVLCGRPAGTLGIDLVRDPVARKYVAAAAGSAICRADLTVTLLVNLQCDSENFQFLVETDFPTPIWLGGLWGVYMDYTRVNTARFV